MNKNHVFGPVNSRRLGRSIGIDLLPFKTCPYDCIYCECGRTTAITDRLPSVVPVQTVIKELEPKLVSRPDYITIAGSGEPTLYPDLSLLINEIHKITRIPVAVLTNGAFLWKPEIRKSILQADFVMPTLAAGTEKVFRQIHRPHKTIIFDQYVQGLIEFGKIYKNSCWLEIFLIEGINTGLSELKRIIEIAHRINPAKIHLNTVDRPPADAEIRAVSTEKMKEFVSLFGPKAEIICSIKDEPAPDIFKGINITGNDLMDYLRRRPATLEDIAAGFGIQKYKAKKILDGLAASGKISETTGRNSEKYYVCST